MPLPLIVPFAIGAGSALVGGAKSVKAALIARKAAHINQAAIDIRHEARSRLDASRKHGKAMLESLGRKKLHVCEKSLGRFVELFGQIKHVELKDSPGLDEVKKFMMDPCCFKEMQELNEMAVAYRMGILDGAVAGGMVAFGAYGAASAFSVASSGTAISALIGGAATNATLAFFGGETLVTGGLGVAGGMCVLGGLFAGPALAVMGLLAETNASENLDKALSNLAQVKAMATEVKTLCMVSDSIAKRARLFKKAIERLETVLNPILDNLTHIIEEEGTDYSSFSPDTRKTILKAAATAQTLKRLVDTPILDAHGSLMEESGKDLDLLSGSAA